MKNKHVISREALATQHLHREEVCADRGVQVSDNKMLPPSRLAPLWSRSNSVASQNVSHRVIRKAVSSIGERSDHAVKSSHFHAPFAPPASMSGSTVGRPESCRCLVPSNSWETSLRYRLGYVGLRVARLPLRALCAQASLFPQGSLNRNLGGSHPQNTVRRSKYSFCGRSS